MSPKFPSATDVLDELISLSEFLEEEEVDEVKRYDPQKVRSIRSYRVPHSRQERNGAGRRDVRERIVIRDSF